jgi:2-oxoglutarate dehydrogenase E2 component (dihydrolipoamide succinyltransferase)
MPSPIKVPALGESITEAIIANWLQPVGARVEIDQPLVELETDKVTVELPSPVAGIILRHGAEKGATVRVGDIIGEVDAGDGQAAATPSPATTSPATTSPSPVPQAAVPSARAEATRSWASISATSPAPAAAEGS